MPASAGDPSDAWWDELYADEEQPSPEVERRPAPRLPNWWENKPDHLPKQDSEQATNPQANTAPTSSNTTPQPPALAPAQQPQHSPAPPGTAGRRHPQQSLLDAWAGISPRLRWLVYHGTAAAFGWGLGITGWATSVTAWIAADRWVNPQSITCYALGLGAVALYRRTRGWWWPIAWLAAVPASSIALGVLLYAPNS
ncbi:hypothetical protein L0F81_17195 [Streptomyces tricolor]|uniref:DUF3649 domain-containing protein n=1 Tax=Streptomyces tricolor TaxID=68277 RepID=A0ABS9JHH3_9ACTN|nr:MULTISPECIES: hypothetical protein [Streptomyces]MCG0065010.1 hypothetical protein [Streptomyces tricolor]